MKKLMMSLAFLTTPLYAAEMIADNGHTGPAQSSNEFKTIFETTDISYNRTVGHLNLFDHMINQSPTWSNLPFYDLIDSLRLTTHEIAKLDDFVNNHSFEITSDSPEKVKLYLEVAQKLKANDSQIKALLEDFSEEKVQKAKEADLKKHYSPDSYTHDAVYQAQAALIISAIRKELNLPGKRQKW